MKRNLSSGDLTADRRAEYAEMLSESGDHAAAVELMEQALELAADWPAGWYQLAKYAEKAGDRQKTAQALTQVVHLADGDVFGAGLKLAALEGRTPDLPPSAYVEGLFDDYADRFDQALVKRLQYSVPQKLAKLVLGHMGEGNRFERVIDLGCGTGLFGAEIAACADYMEGYDLSDGMLAKAAVKTLYQHLARADLSLKPDISGLFGDHHRADLVAAADVMMYLGDLRAAFANAAGLMRPDGVFAFSVEKAMLDHGFELRPSLRYAHSASHVATVLAEQGLVAFAMEETMIRMDAGEPITGLLFLARKAGR